jgi:hypothetical protein
VKNGAIAQAPELKKLAITKRRTKRIQTQSAMQGFGAAHMMLWFAFTDEASSAIETQEQAGDFKEWWVQLSNRRRRGFSQILG